jgi:hypothetical protein
VKIPKSWFQLSEVQVFAVAPYVLQEMTIANKLHVFEAVLEPSDAAVFAKMKPDKVLIQLKRIEFLWRDNIVEPIIPKVVCADVEYIVPAHRFTTLCIAEFAFACDIFDAMMAQGNYKGQRAKPEMLNNLIACLCRPSKGDDANGDIRERFNENCIEKRAVLFSQVPPQYKAYFLLYFLGCKKALAEQFKVLFKKPNHNQQEDKKFNHPVDYGWFKVIFDLADGSTFGKYEDVCHQNLYTILHYLTNKYYDMQELKEASK